MAIRVDKLTAMGARGALQLGKRRMELAGITGEMKVIINRGSITLVPVTAQTCARCGELVSPVPDVTTSALCPACMALSLANKI
jgi:hypothetical protein